MITSGNRSPPFMYTASYWNNYALMFSSCMRDPSNLELSTEIHTIQERRNGGSDKLLLSLLPHKCPRDSRGRRPISLVTPSKLLFDKCAP
jgi:hypothetical protein